jgi:hypothetical protein
MSTPLNPDELQVGTSNGPGIYLAPAGTAAPADLDGAWPSPWRSLGYLSEDGPTIASSIDTEELTPWQSRTPVRTIITARSMTLQFVLWQLNPETLGLYFDADAPAAEPDGSLHMHIRSDAPQHLYAVGIDAKDGNRVLRIAFRRASLTDAGDIQISAGATVPLDVTLAALDDGGELAEVILGELPDTRAAQPLSPSAAAARTAVRVPAQEGGVK